MKTVLLVEDSPDDVFFVERAWKKAEISHALRVAMEGGEEVGLHALHPFQQIAFRGVDLRVERLLLSQTPA